MKTEVIAKVFVTVDGEEFDDRAQAIEHERTVKQTMKGIAALEDSIEDAEETFNEILSMVQGLDEKKRKDFLNALRFLSVERTYRKNEESSEDLLDSEEKVEDVVAA